MSPNSSSIKWIKKLGLKEKVPEVPQPEKNKTDIIIVVMGPTGVGKSTFIREYTKADNVVVGHALQSCTRDVSWYTAPLPVACQHLDGTHRLILVDTPGFDDTFSDDSEILTRVSAWLAKAYNEEKTLGGIIYVNDISQKRMFGSTRMNYNMFQKLCGDKSFTKVVMATTQWDTLADPATGEKRQRELEETFWKDVISKGAKVESVREKPRDQEKIIKHLIDAHIEFEKKEVAKKKRAEVVLQIQKELVELEKSLPATQAGQELRFTLAELIKMQEAAIENGMDEQGVRDLEQKKGKLREQLKAMKLSFTDRLKILFGLSK